MVPQAALGYLKFFLMEDRGFKNPPILSLTLAWIGFFSVEISSFSSGVMIVFFTREGLRVGQGNKQ